MSIGPLSEIPLIDLGPYFAGGHADRQRVAGEVHSACERIGFFLISGHGVDPALCERARDASRTFFDLPPEEKLAIRQRQDDKANRGYEPLGTEHLSATIGVETPPDLKESLSFGPLDVPDDPSFRTEAAAPHYASNIWPERPAAFKPAIEAYIGALDRLGRHLHRIAALAFDLPEDHFDPRLENGFSILRVLNYPQQRTAPEEGQLRAGEHSDYDNLTICLIEDKPGGLQARSPDGTWVDVPVVAGSFVVNIGDQMKRWTNDRWRSTRHRVVNRPRAAGRRLSLCYFVEPRHDAVIECLPTCHSAERAGEISADHRRRLHGREICQPGERRGVERRGQPQVRHRRHRIAIHPVGQNFHQGHVSARSLSATIAPSRTRAIDDVAHGLGQHRAREHDAKPGEQERATQDSQIVAAPPGNEGAAQHHDGD